jgi:hypothetical protein
LICPMQQADWAHLIVNNDPVPLLGFQVYKLPYTPTWYVFPCTPATHTTNNTSFS